MNAILRYVYSSSIHPAFLRAMSALCLCETSLVEVCTVCINLKSIVWLLKNYAPQMPKEVVHDTCNRLAVAMCSSYSKVTVSLKSFMIRKARFPAGLPRPALFSVMLKSLLYRTRHQPFLHQLSRHSTRYSFSVSGDGPASHAI